MKTSTRFAHSQPAVGVDLESPVFPKAPAAPRIEPSYGSLFGGAETLLESIGPGPEVRAPEAALRLDASAGEAPQPSERAPEGLRVPLFALELFVLATGLGVGIVVAWICY
ncbi:MAG TPA: hypothetical protein VHM70_03980 [Polyangiaceae bacterium]|jgi:hypothetical protein|nr:hypothetical protein [Polyangiaceae bacterium]